jgi:flagellar protein FliT
MRDPALPPQPEMDMHNDILPYYESIGHVSQLMLTAARHRDWPALLDAERCCSALITRLQAMDGANHVLDVEERKRKQQIIRRVIAEDAEIRDLTQPWLKQLESHLGKPRLTRDAQPTYS